MRSIVSFNRMFSAAHRVAGHTGHCRKLHGHNYHVDVSITVDSLNDAGFAVDWGDIKGVIDDLDHKLILDANDSFTNELARLIEYTPEGKDSYGFKVYAKPEEWLVLVDGPPTTENLATMLATRVARATLIHNPNTAWVYVDLVLVETPSIQAAAHVSMSRADLEAEDTPEAESTEPAELAVLEDDGGAVASVE